MVKRHNASKRGSRKKLTSIVKVSNKVLVTPVSGTGAFNLLYLYTQASNIPWLDNVAVNYSRFRFIRASAEFVPHVGTTSQGQVAMAFSYDDTDSPPTSMEQIQQMGGSQTRVLYATGKRIICHANTRRQLPSYRYIEPLAFSALPAQDRNNFNPFTLWFATDTPINGQVIGTIHFSFTIQFLDPIFATAHSGSIFTGTSMVGHKVDEITNVQSVTDEDNPSVA